MKTLSSPMYTAYAGAVQRPGYLVSIGFSPVQRYSSQGTVVWNGNTWTAADIKVEGLAVAALQVQGAVIIGNMDDAIGALILAQGVQDRAISIWGFDAAATGSADVQWLCDAVGASATLGTREARISLRHRAEYVSSPRTYVEPSAGFNIVQPAGAALRINGITYILERR